MGSRLKCRLCLWLLGRPRRHRHSSNGLALLPAVSSGVRFFTPREEAVCIGGGSLVVIVGLGASAEARAFGVPGDTALSTVCSQRYPFSAGLHLSYGLSDAPLFDVFAHGIVLSQARVCIVVCNMLCCAG